MKHTASTTAPGASVPVAAIVAPVVVVGVLIAVALLLWFCRTRRLGHPAARNQRPVSDRRNGDTGVANARNDGGAGPFPDELQQTRDNTRELTDAKRHKTPPFRAAWEAETTPIFVNPLATPVAVTTDILPASGFDRHAAVPAGHAYENQEIVDQQHAQATVRMDGAAGPAGAHRFLAAAPEPPQINDEEHYLPMALDKTRTKWPTMQAPEPDEPEQPEYEYVDPAITPRGTSGAYANPQQLLGEPLGEPFGVDLAALLAEEVDAVPPPDPAATVRPAVNRQSKMITSLYQNHDIVDTSAAIMAEARDDSPIFSFDVSTLDATPIEPARQYANDAAIQAHGILDRTRLPSTTFHVLLQGSLASSSESDAHAAPGPASLPMVEEEAFDIDERLQPKHFSAPCDAALNHTAPPTEESPYSYNNAAAPAAPRPGNQYEYIDLGALHGCSRSAPTCFQRTWTRRRSSEAPRRAYLIPVCARRYGRNAGDATACSGPSCAGTGTPRGCGSCDA